LKVRETVKEMPLIKDCIRILKEKGYTLAIATNPIFPKSAVYRRIEWAGLDPRDFVYISHFEKNCYCKPDISFYREVLDAIGKRPEQCIMVGNDVQEDMCAGELGIETFLITDYLIDRSNGDSIICTHKGTYETFHKYVQGLPPVKR
jgi:FMN phosphatase YigB (HAD superfamily)